MHKPEEVTHAIAVLGYQLNPDGTLKPGLKRRLNRAVQLHREGVVIITCGWYPLKELELSRYVEAELMEWYLRDTYGNEPWFQSLVIMRESESTSVPENLLFTQMGFCNLQQLTVVAGNGFVDRASFFASKIFLPEVEVRLHPCDDGIGDPEHQQRLLGDAMCTLENYGQLIGWRDTDGRLRSNWDELRRAHHGCPYYGQLHPMTKII